MPKGQKGFAKKYDELAVLAEIYRMRGLTINQLNEVFFESKHYTYAFMKNLRKEGYLLERYNMQRGKMQGKVYSCSDKAIDVLEKAGKIEKKVKAKDNTPSKNRLRYLVLTNELYAAMMPYGIHMFDSREWKRKHKMDRNTLVRGGLQMLDDTEIAVYLFFSSEQVNGGGLSESSFLRFKNEILDFTQSNRFIVMCYDKKTHMKVVEGLMHEEKAMAKEQLSVIPFGRDGFGLDIIRLSRHLEERKHDLEELLNARLIENHPALEGDKRKFAEYVAEIDGKERYVVDYLTMNLPVLYMLETQYYENVYQKDGRTVDLVCWSPDQKELQQRFEKYPHINIVPVSAEQAKEWLNRMEPQKMKVN